MADEPNFFAVPPSEDPQPPPVGDAPIILGEAPPVETADFFGAPPAANPESAYLGDVSEIPGDANAFAQPTEDAFASPEVNEPIILGEAPPLEDGVAEVGTPAPIEPSEPSPMTKWNEEWQETLKVRKDEENAAKAEALEKARLDLENFQKEREMKRENRMAKNREDEQAKLEAIEADLENDNSWQRVCKMIELQHDTTEDAEDVKRMRDVLIHLKNDLTRASVLV